MTALIDADSLIHSTAWHHRHSDDTLAMLAGLDASINNLLLLTGANAYYGALSVGRDCFRHQRYRYAPYKGKRPPKEDWFRQRETAIKTRMWEQWGFFEVEELEADDVCAWLAQRLRDEREAYIVCSPDKDLDQIPGHHYDYSVKNRHYSVSEDDANRHLWTQMLQGDDTDNIAGVPGIGPDKAKKLLDGVEYIMRRSVVESAYRKYFGGYYGELIFEETYACIRLLDDHHPAAPRYEWALHQVQALYGRDYTPVIQAPQTAVSGVFGDLFGQD